MKAERHKYADVLGIILDQPYHSHEDRYETDKEKDHTHQREHRLELGLTDIDETKTAPIPWDKNKSYKAEWVSEYDRAIKEFCANRGLMIISMEGIIDKSDLEDGLHPNSRGHEKMFQRVKDFLIYENLI